MLKVVFIGDQPSPKNTSPDIAFKGTRSGLVLDEWAKSLNVDYHAVNSTDSGMLASSIYISIQLGQPIITLGLNAKRRTKRLLEKRGWSVETHHLPHPSPRNRLLNDKEYVKVILQDLKDKLHVKKV